MAHGDLVGDAHAAVELDRLLADEAAGVAHHHLGCRQRPTTLASGRFRSLEHRTTGTVRVVRLSNGSHVLRIEDLDTSNGPDLRVYLSELPSNLGWRDYGERYIELGALKGNRGDQNYRIPTGTDLSRYKSLVIWCVRFKVGFGVAPLT